MKPANPAESPSKGPPKGPAKVPAVIPPSEVESKTGLGISERRRIVRTLPVPEAVETNGDSEWATFQALISDNQKI